ncbi:MAG: ABC transporter permease [Phycisphaerae bacterium]
MVYQIVRKEILENLLSLRFILSLLLIISLFTVGGFVSVKKQRQQIDDYWRETNKNLSALSEQTEQLYKLAFFEQTIWRKPKSLTFCAEAFEKYLPNYFRFSMFGMDYPEVKSRTNFLISGFNDIDWVFIISVFLSFVVMLFTYDSICGEKEAGTLRLMLASSIPRHKILLGKYFGAMFTLGIPLLVGLLINLIIVVSSEVINIGTRDWLRIFGVVLLSLVYLSIFVLLGMFVSSRTAHSANSMVVLLLIWVALVILIPSMGRIVSNAFQKIPTQTEMNRQQSELKEQIVSNAFSGKYGENALSFNPDPNNPTNNPPARARFRNAITDAKNQIIENRLNQMTTQVAVGRRFTRISPTMIYRCASEVIVGTGIRRFSDLRRQIKRYQEDLEEYIRSKDQEDPESLHLIFEEEGAARSWGAISGKPVSFDTVPKYQEQEATLGESLQWAFRDIGLLVLFNLVFLTASFASFLMYDVR